MVGPSLGAIAIGRRPAAGFIAAWRERGRDVDGDVPAASRIALPDGGILYREGGAVRAGGVDRRLAASSLSVRIAWTRPIIMDMNSGVLSRRARRAARPLPVLDLPGTADAPSRAARGSGHAAAGRPAADCGRPGTARPVRHRQP